MQKILKSMSSFLLAIAMCFSIVAVVNVTSSAVMVDAATDNYYSSITAQSGTALLGQLHDLMVSTHKTYTSYDDCKTPAKVIQTDPGTANNTVRDFYTQENISSTWNGNNAGTWNREHVWCQSLSNGLWGTSGGGSDMHHIRPSEVRLNGTRGNHTYGEANGGTPAYYKDTNGNDKYVGGYVSGDTFEPLDKVKGDVARIVMYVYMHYNTAKNVGGSSSDKSYFGTLKFTMVMTPNSESEAIKLLLKWNEADPVDDIERTRNEAAYKIQGNRNPFIDNSSYADAIWGNGSITPGGDPEVTLTGLSLNPSTLNLAVGQTGSLAVSATPSNASKAVTWSTSNSSVATVSGGTVTARAEGTATITATSTVNSIIKATATVKVTKSSTPPTSESSVTIDISKFASLGSYSFHNWSSGGISGIAFIYGSGNKMQFNSKQNSHYLASTTPTSGPIKSVTVKLESDTKDWQLLTSNTAYSEITGGNPTNGTDQGTKSVTTSGTTWTLSGSDTYFALVYNGTGVCYIDSIVVTFGIGGGEQEHVCGHVCSTCHKCTDKNCTDPVCSDKCAGHDGSQQPGNDNVKLQAFHQAVLDIVPNGALSLRFESINKAIIAYLALTDSEKLSAADDFQLLQAAINDYNKTVGEYNGEVESANKAVNGGKK